MHTRFLLLLLLSILIVSSCKKKASNASCEGFFISTIDHRSGGTEAEEYIYYTNTEHNIGQLGGYLINYMGYEIKSTAYNWRKHTLYLAKPDDTYNSKGRWYFKYFNVDAGVVADMGSVVVDPGNVSSFGLSLVCNTTADIVYALGRKNDSGILYEISRNGILNVREVLAVDSSVFYYNPAAVDEIFGSIFFMSKHDLMKIDPATAEVTTVATYSDADPAYLLYNDNDKMFYALDNLHKYRLLRIDPTNGSLTVVGTVDTDPNWLLSLKLDRCNNQCILVQSDSTSAYSINASWLNLRDAKVAKSALHIWANESIEYVNEKFPANYPH
jgi:hypothetical protein